MNCDEDPSAELEAAEYERMETRMAADQELADLEDAGNAVHAARKAGRCPHQGASGYLPGEDRGLSPGQLRCNDSGRGCGQVWDSDEEWHGAMEQAMWG